MREFESLMATARKLAALADPKNGGAPGELVNARLKLGQFLSKHGITLEQLAKEERDKRLLICAPAGVLSLRSFPLVRLAKQCLAFVTGENRLMWHRWVGGKKKGLYMAEAEVTPLEFQDWQACFQHYAQDFLDTEEELKRRAKAARKAVEFALEGFVTRHEIFPPAKHATKESTPLDELAALITAAAAAQGDAWQRKAGAIEGQRLLQESN